MSFSKISAIASLVALASAHGTVTGIVADGTYYVGYHANYQYESVQPVVVGWSTPEDLDNGFVSDYTSSDIICHKGATNAKTSATVKAGGTVELQWTVWPESHKGPVIDYLADCGGDCTTVDKTTLEFFKIDGVGLIDDTTVPGNWASDTLIANNNSWTVTIPSTIAPGNYVLRHEIIALHAAETSGGAQNYPQCFNLEVTGAGTDAPTGTLGTALYTATDPGILVNIYAAIASYIVPGPALYSGAVSATQGVVSATAVASSVAASSAAAGVVTSAPVATATPVSSGSIATAPYSNSTIAVVSSSKTRKSACKAKTTSAAVLATASSVPTAVAGDAETTSLFTTSADSVTIPTSLPSTTAESSPSAVETSASTSTQTSSGSSSGSGTGTSAESTPATSGTSSSTSAPAGTTLGDLLSWISSFYEKYSGKTYTEATVARRHARDLAAREMDKFSRTGEVSKPTGTFPSGAAHPSHFNQQHRPQGTGVAHGTGHRHHGHAHATGTFSAGSAFPTGKSGFVKHAGF